MKHAHHYDVPICIPTACHLHCAPHTPRQPHPPVVPSGLCLPLSIFPSSPHTLPPHKHRYLCSNSGGIKVADVRTWLLNGPWARVCVCFGWRCFGWRCFGWRCFGCVYMTRVCMSLLSPHPYPHTLFPLTLPPPHTGPPPSSNNNTPCVGMACTSHTASITISHNTQVAFCEPQWLLCLGCWIQCMVVLYCMIVACVCGYNVWLSPVCVGLCGFYTHTHTF